MIGVGMKKKSIELREAFRLSVIEDNKKSVLSSYDLKSLIFKLYEDKSYRELPIRKVVNPEPEDRTINDLITELEETGVISQHLFLPIYFVNNQKKPTAQQYICTLNPLSYLAFISAMEWHGLTDRIPNTLHLQTCSSSRYKILFSEIASEKLSKRKLYQPRTVEVPNYDGKYFEFHQSRSFTLPNEIYGSGGVRVASVGDTFLDMLKSPDLCGGFEHVLDIFQSEAENYLAVITRAVSKKGNSMDKARAGYILEELCGLSHKNIDKWKESVQRGGSRRLDMSKPYKNVYSETWCISINN